MREIFAKRLRMRQKQLGLNQAQLAKQINVAPGTCSAYLNKEKVPTLEKAVEIAKALDVTVGWLCGENVGISAGSSYSDVIKALNSVIGVPWVAHTDIELVDFEVPSESGYFYPVNGVAFRTTDPVLLGFYTDYKRVKELYDGQIIDKEMHDAWVEKRLDSLRNVSLDVLPF